ncbi:MAG: hypothetical protein AAFQ44_03090 [Pseudomonadota bacterium]
MSKLVGPLAPISTSLLTVHADARDSALDGVALAVEFRRMRQEVMAICEAFGACAYAHADDTVAAWWPPSIPADHRQASVTKAQAAVNALFQSSFELRFVYRDVDLNLSSGTNRWRREIEGRRRSVSANGTRPNCGLTPRSLADAVTCDAVADADGTRVSPTASVDLLRDLKWAADAGERFRVLQIPPRVIDQLLAAAALPVSGDCDWCPIVVPVLSPSDPLAKVDDGFERHLAFALAETISRECNGPTTDARNRISELMGAEDELALFEVLTDTSLGGFERTPLSDVTAKHNTQTLLSRFIGAICKDRKLLLTLCPNENAMRALRARFDWLQTVSKSSSRFAVAVLQADVSKATPEIGTGLHQVTGDRTHPGHVVCSQLAALGPNEILASALAVFTGPFHALDAAQMLDMTPQQLQPSLSELVAAGVLTVSASRQGPLYGFAAELLRAQAVARLRPKARVDLNARAAAALASCVDQMGDTSIDTCERAATIAAHFEVANERGLACDWWYAAGQRALRLGREQLALDALARALSLRSDTATVPRDVQPNGTPGVHDLRHSAAVSSMPADETDIRLDIVRALHRTDQRLSKSCHDHIQRIIALSRKQGSEGSAREFEAQSLLGEIMRERGNVQAADHALARMIDLVADPAVACISSQLIETNRVLLAWHKGQFPDAIGAFERLQPLNAGEIDDNESLVPIARRRHLLTTAHMAIIQTLRFQAECARVMADDAISQAEHVSEATVQARVLLLASHAALWQGNVSALSALGMALKAISRQHKMPVREAVAGTFLAACRRHADPDRALRDIDGIIRVLSEHRSHVNLILVRYLKARVLTDVGRYQLADAAIRDAVKAMRQTGFFAYRAEIERLEAVVGHEAGRLSRSQTQRRLKQALALAKRQEAFLFVSEIAISATSLDFDLGDTGT